MATVRVFKSGNSQAVRLPKKYRVNAKELEIFQRGTDIVLREKEKSLLRAFDLLAELPDDLALPNRAKDLPQKRKGL
ncbi:MAG TPA: AbrB/MazE/SpoVT family DNA-binding domain-containing protein [Candidatus Sulfotelmatobacter sp.]|jgi:antitoxin VapB